MDWMAIGSRIRTQREYLGYTREQFAGLLDVTPKFCADAVQNLPHSSAENRLYPLWKAGSSVQRTIDTAAGKLHGL